MDAVVSLPVWAIVLIGLVLFALAYAATWLYIERTDWPDIGPIEKVQPNPDPAPEIGSISIPKGWIGDPWVISPITYEDGRWMPDDSYRATANRAWRIMQGGQMVCAGIGSRQVTDALRFLDHCTETDGLLPEWWVLDSEEDRAA